MTEDEHEIKSLLRSISDCIQLLLDGSARCSPTFGKGTLHVLFTANGAWFKIMEDADGCWVVSPSDYEGNTIERPGRPDDLPASIHPDTEGWQVASIAVMTAARWMLPDILCNPRFITDVPGHYYH